MDLVDSTSVASQEPRQADAIRAGAFHAERDQPALRADVVPTEVEELDEAGQRCGDEQLGESPAESVEQDRDVLVLVGVDTDDDIVAS